MWRILLLTVIATALVTFISTFFLLRTIAETSSTEKLTTTENSASAGEPSPPKYPGLYRAQGIPPTVTKASIKRLLQSVLACDESSLIVRSFADDARGKPTKVATFTFTGSAESLSGRGRRWTFPIPEDQCPSAEGQSMRLSIDDHFEGFTPLNSFGSSKEHKIDFIAISGLGSNAYGSFVERGGSHMWLTDSLPSDIPGVRVLTYGYDSHLHKSNSFQDIEAISSSFRTNLGTVRPQIKHTLPKPLIFLGHSLGGIVLKKALVQMKNSTYANENENFQSTYAVLFFGVPNQGMDIGSLIPMAGEQNLPLLVNLGKESELLRVLHRDFLLSFDYRSSKVISYYETKVSPTAKWIEGRWKMKGERVVLVGQSSATHGRSWENLPHHIQAINRSHSNLVKFSANDEVYDRILVRLKEFAEDSVKIVELRFADKADLSDSQRQCLKELNRPRFWEIRDIQIHEPEPGTLKWFFESPEFRFWRDDQHSRTLWIRGSPGQGKSVLAKAVIDHMDQWLKLDRRSSLKSIAQLGSAKVIYFFFHKQDEDKNFNTPQSLVRAFIVQLLTSSHMFQHLPRTYQARPNDLFTERFGTLWNVFCDLIGDPRHRRIYCVVDGLDECEGSMLDLLSRMMKLSSKLASESGSRLKLFITSRPVPDVANELENSMHIDLQAKTEDIKLFVDKKTSKLPRRFSPELQRRAAELLLRRTERTFLWVSIVVKRIERMVLPSVAKLTRAIDESSTDLDELYSDITRQIGEGPVEGQKLLAWVVYGRRTLTLKELEAALATQIDSESKESTEDFRADLNEDVVASTAGVILEISADTVHLIHQSAKDFILNRNQLANSPFLCDLGLAGSDPNIYIAKICMTYLNFDDFQSGPSGSLQSLMKRKSIYPLYDYASRKWHTHIKSQADIEKVLWVLQHIIEPRSPKLLSWGEAAGIQDFDAANNAVDLANKASIAWLAGIDLHHTTLTPEQVEAAAKNLRNGYEQLEIILRPGTAEITNAAKEALARTGNEAIVKLLLEKYPDTMITRSMILAAAGNRKSGRGVMKLLLDARKDNALLNITADLAVEAISNYVSGQEILGFLLAMENSKITEGAIIKIMEIRKSGDLKSLLGERDDIEITEAVVYALPHYDTECMEVIKQLISKDDLKITYNGVIALIENSTPEVIELLLSRADVQVDDGVVAACTLWGDARTVGLSLDRKADKEISEVVMNSAALNSWHGREILQLLLSRSNSPITESMLKAAAANGQQEMMDFLLSRGEIPITTSVLEVAAGNEEVGDSLMGLLLDRSDVKITESIMKTVAGNRIRGYDILGLILATRDATDVPITSAVLTAAAGNSSCGDEIISLLLNGNASQIPGSVLEAAYCNHLRGKYVVEAVLNSGGDSILEWIKKWIDLQPEPIRTKAGKELGQLMTIAASKGHKKVVQMLLKSGVSARERDNISQKTALHCAAESGSVDVVENLLARGADIHAEDGDQMTAIHRAVMMGNFGVISVLLWGKAWPRGAVVLPSRGNEDLLGEEAVIHRTLIKPELWHKRHELARGNLLHVLAYHGIKGGMEVLLEENCDPNTVDDFGTALHWAACGGNEEVVQLLLKRGANIHATERFGTALHWAARVGHEKVVQLLLDKGAQIAAVDAMKETALHYAVQNGHEVVVRHLLRSGADVAAVSSHGHTALELVRSSKLRGYLEESQSSIIRELESS